MLGKDVAFEQWVSDMDERNLFSLDAMRAANPVLVEAECAKRRRQTEYQREELRSRVQMIGMKLDDARNWVDEEQLRLDGAETMLLTALAGLEERRLAVAQLDHHVASSEAELDSLSPLLA